MSKQYNNEDLKTVVEHEISDDKKTGNARQSGSMAPDMAEMKRLGKDMKSMKTNKTLKNEGLVPDPDQTE